MIRRASPVEKKLTPPKTILDTGAPVIHIDLTKRHGAAKEDATMKFSTMTTEMVKTAIRTLESTVATTADATDKALWQWELDAYCAELARRGEDC